MKNSREITGPTMIYDLHWTHPGSRNGEIHENHTTDDRNGLVLRSLVYRSLPGRLHERQHRPTGNPVGRSGSGSSSPSALGQQE